MANSRKSGKSKQIYTKADLEKAISKIRTSQESVFATSKEFKIPRTTLIRHLASNEIATKSGPCPILGPADEAILVEWIKTCTEKGTPRRKADIIAAAEKILELRNNSRKLSDGWFRRFMSRHTDLSVRKPEKVTSASSIVSETDIRNWFKKIDDYFLKHDLLEVLTDPDRVFNADESFFYLDPSDSTVIAPKGCKNVYQIEKSPSKSGMTVLYNVSGSGIIVPPMIVYEGSRIKPDIIQSVPSDWGIGASQNGWMTQELIIGYIKKVFDKFLNENNVKRPVIWFLDGHSSHMSYEI
jgi:hypothetical protein